MIRIGIEANTAVEPCPGCGFPARQMVKVSGHPGGKREAGALKVCRMCAVDLRRQLVSMPEDLRLPRTNARPLTRHTLLTTSGEKGRA